MRHSANTEASHCKVRPFNSLEGLTLLLLAMACFVLWAPTAHAAISKAPNNLGLVGYWSFDDCKLTKATDSSGYGNHGTLTNFALSGATSNWMTGAQAKRGCALNFDGVDDYINNGNPAVLRLTSAVTVSAWIKMRSATDGLLVWEYSNYGLSYNFTLIGGAASRFNFAMLKSVTWTIANSTTAPVMGTWYHVVGVYNGTNGKLYINGALEATSATVTAPLDTGTGSAIGGYSGGDQSSNADIDDVRIYNRALSPNEVAALYNTGAAKVKAPNNLGLVGYWSFDDCKLNKATDSSGYGNTGTLTNFALSGATSNWLTGAQAKRGCALNFDGTDDYVSVGAPSSLAVTNAFSISAWVKSSNLSGRRGVVSKVATGSDYIIIETNGATFRVLAGNLSGTATALSSGAIDTNWHHVVFKYDGTTSSLYVDGTFVTSATVNLSPYGWNTGGGWVLGGNESGFVSYYDGSLDDIRIYNRALSANEVSSLYNASSAKVKAANNSGLVGYWSFDDCKLNKATDSSGYGNTGTLTNFALSGATSNWLSGSSAKRGCALNFDGTDDYVGLGTAMNSQVLSAATFSAWIKPSTIPSDSGILANYNGNAGTDGSKDGFASMLYNSSGGRLSFILLNNGGGNYIGRDTDSVIVAGNWYHVVMTWDGTFSPSGFKIYVNGVRSDTTDVVLGTVAGNDASAREFAIGAVQYQASAPKFPGSIDDVRIYNRALSANEVRSLYNAY